MLVYVLAALCSRFIVFRSEISREFLLGYKALDLLEHTLAERICYKYGQIYSNNEAITIWTENDQISSLVYAHNYMDSIFTYFIYTNSLTAVQILRHFQ
jgi:hypothetical protein